MFEIEYKGANAVVIATKKTKLVADPRLSLAGGKDLNTKAVVVVATEDRFVVQDDTTRLVIDGPGEYEVGDFSIIGTAAKRHLDGKEGADIATIYRIEVGDVRIGLLGNITAPLDETQLERLDVIDVLILPVGGNGYTLGVEEAVTVIRQVEPKVVVPVHYADSALKYEVLQDDFELFVKTLGAPVESVGSSYKIKSPATLPATLSIIQIARS